jgi:hypothetical protein
MSRDAHGSRAGLRFLPYHLLRCWVRGGMRTSDKGEDGQGTVLSG